MSGLTSREMVEGKDLILPIWHRVGAQDVMKYSPPLADKKAGSSVDGINSLIRDLIKKIKPDESPLIVARDYLAKLNVDVPPISDEWWLDLVEYKEFLKYPDINMGKRWIFPLPFQNDDHGLKRGWNIASTALQMDWSFEGEELNISPITHPDIVHEFIHRWPGLYECARENPGVLAMYVPQLTIPGFDSGFEDVFDDLLKFGNKEADRILSYGRHATVDNKEPLCGDVIALRHKTFGNYSPKELGYWYFDAYDTNYIRSHWSAFEGLIWLVSSDSDWLPVVYRKTLIQGICGRCIWLNRSSTNYDNSFVHSLISKKRKQFNLTKRVLSGLNELVIEANGKLELAQGSDTITQALIDSGLITGYYNDLEELERMRHARR